MKYKQKSIIYVDKQRKIKFNLGKKTKLQIELTYFFVLFNFKIVLIQKINLLLCFYSEKKSFVSIRPESKNLKIIINFEKSTHDINY